ncbi:MAG TPA: transporter substrate-binding domain-containing protein [Desulfobacterales bacterium]|nr:transporter substrate-binding domain-containing protein [Desulfobacterales bacterium]
MGWQNLYPYQYSKDIHGHGPLLGLDIKLIRAVAEELDYDLVFMRIIWEKLLQKLRNGQLDMGLNAIKLPEREQDFWISDPVRRETTVLYVNRHNQHPFSFKTVNSLLDFVKKNNMKLGVTKGFMYTNDTINLFIKDPNNSKYLLPADEDATGFINLINKKAAAILIDRTVASALIFENNWSNDVKRYYPLKFETKNIHYILSKKSVSQETVKKLNAAIKKLKQSGAYSKIIVGYLFPVMLNVTVNTWWYFYIVVIGTLAYSLHALKLAIAEKYSLLGSFIFVSIFALGGGTVRDIMTGSYPVFFMKEPLYLYIVIGTTLAVFFITYIYSWFYRSTGNWWLILRIRSISKKTVDFFSNYVFMIVDAMGLAAFTVFGVIAALAAKAFPLVLWGPILAVITTSGGGIICDIMRNDDQPASMKDNFYPEISAIWGFILSLMINFMVRSANANDIFTAVVITVIGTFLTRLLVIYLKIPSPSFAIFKISRFRHKKT